MLVYSNIKKLEKDVLLFAGNLTFSCTLQEFNLQQISKLWMP